MTLRMVVAPLVAAYAVVVGTAWYSLRHPVPRPRRVFESAEPGWGRLLRWMVTTALGGYAFFLLVVLVFHVALARQRSAFTSALEGGAFLAFVVAVPLFALLSWVAWLAARRSR